MGFLCLGLSDLWMFSILGSQTFGFSVFVAVRSLGVWAFSVLGSQTFGFSVFAAVRSLGV